jgi:hypothetical protein
MSKHFLRSLRQSLTHFGIDSKTPRVRGRGYRRTLGMERLEDRQMLSITTLQNISTSQDTGEKPQSKMFEYAGQWWTVMPNSTGTWVFRLDGTSWTPTQQITTNRSVHADVKVVGDLAHVLLYGGSSSQLATLQYDSGPDNRFEPWSLRPQLVNVALSSGVETATLDVDSTGRMWIASDASSTVEVRYSDGLYTSFSAPITVASGISSDDISAVIAMPGNKLGVFWSNQSTDRFGFRVHSDGDAPGVWSADERPASQSALNVGAGMADDHMHLAVASDGTLYAAVKTSYDKSGYPKMALLVRRPNGTWDNLYEVDGGGTRPVIALSEAAGKLIIAYTSNEGGGDIYYRESPLGTINLSPRKVLINGGVNNVTTTKSTTTDSIAFMADEKSVLFSFDTSTPNLPPVVFAGNDGTAVTGTAVNLNGSATDDGQPTPSLLSVLWSVVSGPGTVAFANSALAATTATFSAAGNYVLQLAASDGLLSRTDTVAFTVTSPNIPPIEPPVGGGTPQQIAFQNGLFPSVAYAGMTDTRIAAKNSTKNYGNDTRMTIDGSPDEAGLFRWDISAIPVGSTVDSVTIEFNVTGSSRDSYEVYALQRAWNELSATWQRYSTGNNWASAGANGAADAQGAVLGQLAATTTGTYRISFNSAGVAAVQQWIDDPTMNYGIIIKDYAVSKAVEIRTSETSTASQRPKLVINFKPNTPPVVDLPDTATAQVGQPLVLGATVTDDGKPTGVLLTALWTQQSGPGTAIFGDNTLVDTTATFDQPGTYVLRLTVSDSLLSGFDELSVSVT